MPVQASAASCWVVGSSTAAAVPLSLSARRDSDRASRSIAVTAFADPHVQFGLRFRTPGDAPANDLLDEATAAPEPIPGPAADAPAASPVEAPQVVSLDAFRRRPPSKD